MIKINLITTTLITLLLGSCSHTDKTTRGIASSPELSLEQSKEFYNGLWSPPGSINRINSAKFLQNWLDHVTMNTLPKVPHDSGSQKQFQITKNIFQMTADYLKSDKTCAPEEKVRLYRGVAKNQLYQDQQKNWLSTWSSWNYNFVMNGQAIPAEKMETHRADPISDLQFKTVDQKTCTNCTKNFIWNEITNWHAETGSDTSPLLSTSLEWSIAKKFANPYLIVMDVCIDRAAAVFNGTQNFAKFHELEVYLPLMALPEEIVSVIEIPPADPFFKPEEKWTTPPNDLTRSMRKLFLGKDLPFDTQYLTKVAPMLDYNKPWHEEYKKNFQSYDLYSQIADRYSGKNDIAQWRKSIMQKISQVNGSETICRYAYDKYTKSKIYKLGAKPVRDFTLPQLKKIENAKFDTAEYQTVYAWSQDWNKEFSNITGSNPDLEKFQKGKVKYSKYFNEFEIYHIYKQGLFKTYLANCK